MSSVRRSAKVRKPTMKAKASPSISRKRNAVPAKNKPAEDDWESICSDNNDTVDTTKDPVNSKTLSKDIGYQPEATNAHDQERDINWLLDRLHLENSASAAARPPIQQSFTPTHTGPVDPMVYLTGFTRSTTVLDICDFVNVTPVTVEWSDCDSTADAIDQYVKARSGPRRPKLEDLTISQWGLANTRIMHKLYPQGTPGIASYLAYTCKVFELFGKFDRVLVLRYDRRYIEMQAANGFAWGSDLPHLDTMMLVGKPSASSKPNTNFKPVCKLFNRTSGCMRGHCTYRHVCHKCGEGHPVYEHRESTNTSQARPLEDGQKRQ